MTLEPVPGINLEFKTPLADSAVAESALRRLGAHHAGLLYQRDTYFSVAAGRLKLREQDNVAELIAYDRPNAVSGRWSRYTCTPVADPAAVLTALTAEHGLRGVVTKSRSLWLYENARIHIDEVEGLCGFLEIEIINPRTDAEARSRLADLLSALGLEPASGVGSSYIDLLEDAGRARR